MTLEGGLCFNEDQVSYFHIDRSARPMRIHDPDCILGFPAKRLRLGFPWSDFQEGSGMGVGQEPQAVTHMVNQGRIADPKIIGNSVDLPRTTFSNIPLPEREGTLYSHPGH